MRTVPTLARVGDILQLGEAIADLDHSISPGRACGMSCALSCARTWRVNARAVKPISGISCPGRATAQPDQATVMFVEPACRVPVAHHGQRSSCRAGCRPSFTNPPGSSASRQWPFAVLLPAVARITPRTGGSARGTCSAVAGPEDNTSLIRIRRRRSGTSDRQRRLWSVLPAPLTTTRATPVALLRRATRASSTRSWNRPAIGRRRCRSRNRRRR